MRVAVGAVVWTAVFLLLFRWLVSTPDPELSPSGMLLQYATHARQTVPLFLDPPQIIAIGDPIFVAGGGQGAIIGRITGIVDPQKRKFHAGELVEADRIIAELNGGWRGATGEEELDRLEFSFHRTPKSMAWVVKTMLPPAKRQEIAAIIIRAVEQNQQKFVTELQPLLMESLRQSGEVLREDLRAAIIAREEQIRQLAGRYQVELVQEKLVPLFREEIWPIIEEEGLPVATEMGQQIWQHASVWRLSWRYLYDISPLPQRDLTRREFQRLIDEEIAPLFAVWLPKILETQRKIFARLAENPRVRETATEIMTTLAQDKGLQAIVIDVIQEVLTDNDRLRSAWQGVWESPQAKAALDDLNRNLEPSITEIGEAMFGNPRTRITPEFSTVLRNKVLFKDERWLSVSTTEGTAEKTADGRWIVRPSAHVVDSPFHVPARPRN